MAYLDIDFGHCPALVNDMTAKLVLGYGDIVALKVLHYLLFYLATDVLG